MHTFTSGIGVVVLARILQVEYSTPVSVGIGICTSINNWPCSCTQNPQRVSLSHPSVSNTNPMTQVTPAFGRLGVYNVEPWISSIEENYFTSKRGSCVCLLLVCARASALIPAPSVILQINDDSLWPQEAPERHAPCEVSLEFPIILKWLTFQLLVVMEVQMSRPLRCTSGPFFTKTKNWKEKRKDFRKSLIEVSDASSAAVHWDPLSPVHRPLHVRRGRGRKKRCITASCWLHQSWGGEGLADSQQRRKKIINKVITLSHWMIMTTSSLHCSPAKWPCSQGKQPEINHC